MYRFQPNMLWTNWYLPSSSDWRHLSNFSCTSFHWSACVSLRLGLFTLTEVRHIVGHHPLHGIRLGAATHPEAGRTSLACPVAAVHRHCRFHSGTVLAASVRKYGRNFQLELNRIQIDTWLKLKGELCCWLWRNTHFMIYGWTCAACEVSVSWWKANACLDKQILNNLWLAFDILADNWQIIDL